MHFGPQQSNCFNLFLVLALTICFGFQQKASAQTYYTVTDIGYLRTTEIRQTFPRGLNSLGQVVGHSVLENSSRQHAFLWQNGVMSDINPLNSSESYATGINDSGQIVGFLPSETGRPIAAFLLTNGVFTNLNSLIWQSGVFASYGMNETSSLSIPGKINNAGQIIGSVAAAFNNITPNRAFFYDNGAVMDIGCQSGFGLTASNAESVNNLGQVVGQCYIPNSQTNRAFIWHAGVTTDLEALNNIPGTYAFVSDVNDSGKIVGRFFSVSAQGNYVNRGFLYDGGVVTNLDASNGADAYPHDINSNNQIVGTVEVGGHDGSHGAIQSGGEWKDLNELTPYDPYRFITNCRSINDQGQILCSRLIRGSRGNGGVVLNPVQDTTAPYSNIHDFTFDATSTAGGLVGYAFSVYDDWDRTPTSSFSHPSNTFFPMGTTTVSYNLSDDSGNVLTGTFSVTVIDTPPDLFLPEPIFVDATSPSGAVVNYIVSANDLVDGEKTVTCNRASGSVFPIGETTVSCSVTDTAANTTTGEFLVFVLGTEQEMPLFGLTTRPSPPA